MRTATLTTRLFCAPAVALGSAFCIAADSAAPAPTANAAAVLIDGRGSEHVSLSVIDRKLALSLAVETHLQVRVLEYASPALRDSETKDLAKRKLELYRALLTVLNDLTNGEAQEALERAGLLELPQQAAGETVVVNSSEAPDAPTDASSEPRRRGGLRAVVQKVSDSAILRVRMDIARKYLALLHADLDPSKPDEFDRRYMSADVVNQMQVVAMLKVFEEQASDDFASILERARATAEDHLEDAQQTARRLQQAATVTPKLVDADAP